MRASEEAQRATHAPPMLLRHSASYLLARGVPGIVNFASLALYTRLLAPADFGAYALVVAGVGLAHVIGFQWLQLVISRFFPEERNAPARLLDDVQSIFLALSVLSMPLGIALAALFVGSGLVPLLLLTIPLLVSQAWMELNLALSAADLRTGRYGLLLATKTLIALVVGASLAWGGFGAYGPVLGLICGNVSSALAFGRSGWRGARPRRPDPGRLDDYLRYGMPLVVTFALAWIVTSSDRMLIGLLLGAAQTGVYAAGYDLAQYSLGLLLSIVQVAAYPLAVRALADRGEAAAREQMRQNGELIISIALAACGGLVALAPQIARYVVGDRFTGDVAALIPLIATGAALGGIKAFYFDMSFHLGRNSRPLVHIGVATAVVNVVLNLFLLPRLGVVGAAYANVLSYALASVLSAVAGRRAFPLPGVAGPLVKGVPVAVATGLAAISATAIGEGSPLSLVAGVVAGGLAFIGAAFIVNLAGLRVALLHARGRLA